MYAAESRCEWTLDGSRSPNAGTNAAIRTGYILMQNGFEVRVLDLGNELDPDDYFKLKENNNSSFQQLIKDASHPIN